MQKLWLRARAETKRFPARPTCHSRAVVRNPMKMQKNITLLLLMTLGINQIFACQCELKDDIKAEYSSTEVIVHAKVLSKEIVTFANTLTEDGLIKVKSKYQDETEKLEFLKKDWIIKVEMEILSIYKGKGLSKKIVVYTSRLAATCGYLDFMIGQEFQIYLSSDCYFGFIFKKADLKNKDYNGYWTNRCTRTKAFDLNEDKELKKLMVD